MDIEQLLLLYSIAAGASVCIGTWCLLNMYQELTAGKVVIDTSGTAENSILFRLMRPLARPFAGIVSNAARRAEEKAGDKQSDSFILSSREKIDKLLVAAGRPEALTSDEFIGVMIVGAVVGTGMGAVVLLRVNFVPVLFIGAGLGGFVPLVWLRDRVQRRQNAIRKQLPYSLDLLTLAVEAGLDFTVALGRIMDRLGRTPLAVELGTLTREIQLGKTRIEALRALSERVSLAELTSVVSALVQAEELGASLGPILRIQSEQQRQARSQRAEKKAMEAPVKILFPLIAFIFPTTFIIIFGPMALKYIL